MAARAARRGEALQADGMVSVGWRSRPLGRGTARTILVSDGFGDLPVADEPRGSISSTKLRGYSDMIDWHARSAQKRQLIESMRNGAGDGIYRCIVSTCDSYDVAGVLPCRPERTHELAIQPARFVRDAAVW